ncbi:MFS general substrate transporter [Panaeolus papilionaceus]|nr:MFS general substrate transporter [Panaeolus papilionaceus]
MAIAHLLHRLVPTQEQRHDARPLLNVFKSLTLVQWAHLFCGWLAWTSDAMDFFSVSLSVTRLQESFGKPTSEITTALTLTLLFRPLGALTFGILADRFGRKWPLVVNLVFVVILELGTGFTQTFHRFLALRSLFGIGMGGIWGLATSTALENLPVEARGLASGIVQEGWAAGYLIPAVVNLFLVPRVASTWRSLFYTCAGFSVLAACIRAILHESEMFIRAKELRKAQGMEQSISQTTRIFTVETGRMFRAHWMLCIYAVLFMAGLNFLAHGSQDLYPTYLQQSKGFSSHDATVATIIGTCVYNRGSIFASWLSQYTGRRLFIMYVHAFIPLWILPSSFGALAAGVFWVQWGVQGVLGRNVMPIQLAELSPPAFRATFPGVTYQIGALISSASAQIEATAGGHLRTTIIKNAKVTDVPDYATVQGILIGTVVAFTIFITIIGPELHRSHFEKHKITFLEGSIEEDATIEERPYDGSIDEVLTQDVVREGKDHHLTSEKASV